MRKFTQMGVVQLALSLALVTFTLAQNPFGGSKSAKQSPSPGREPQQASSAAEEAPVVVYDVIGDKKEMPKANFGVPIVDKVKSRTDHLNKCFFYVDYPWKVLTRPSIEMRLVTSYEIEPADILPVQFRKNYFKDKIANTIRTCRKNALSDGATAQVTPEEKLTFDVLGMRTNLGGTSVMIKKEYSKKANLPGFFVDYFYLDGWSLNRHELLLDVPPEWYDQAGAIYVWMMRDGEPVWGQEFQWEGPRYQVRIAKERVLAAKQAKKDAAAAKLRKLRDEASGGEKGGGGQSPDDIFK